MNIIGHFDIEPTSDLLSAWPWEGNPVGRDLAARHSPELEVEEEEQQDSQVHRLRHHHHLLPRLRRHHLPFKYIFELFIFYSYFSLEQLIP